MTEKRKFSQTLRFSPAQYNQRNHDIIVEPVLKNTRLQTHEDEIHEPSSSSCIKNEICPQEIDVSGDIINEEILLHDVGTSACEIGNAIRSYNMETNIDVLDNTTALTKDIQSLDVIGVLTTPINGQQLRDCLAGLCVMVNRLMSENQFLMREIQSLRANQRLDQAHRFDSLFFRKRNIARAYVYAGDSYGIPEVNFTPIIDRFDLNVVRKNEPAVNKLRRFVKYLLENAIPTELHSKFTLRERAGMENLIECPPDLIILVREICLEAVSLSNVITEDDKERREDMMHMINRFIKYALQELRRIPRKSKKALSLLRPLSAPSNDNGINSKATNSDAAILRTNGEKEDINI